MEWFREYGFGSNPLTTTAEETVQRGLFSGFERESGRLMQFIEDGEICIVTGPYGVGKTALLMHLQSQLKAKYNTFFVSCSEDPEFDVKESIRAKRTPWEKIRRREYPGRESVFFLNELKFLGSITAQSIKINTKDYGRIKAVVCATADLERAGLEKSFLDRVGSRVVKLRPMTKKDANAMIKARFSEGHNPLDKDALDYIFRRAKYIPRKILENAELVCIAAEGRKRITVQNARKALAKQ